jgi:glycosyltransferase involved in cell wall biosynthesis
MRVLTLIDSLDASGGAERSLAAVAPHLVRQGIDLHVGYLHERPTPLESVIADAGASVHGPFERGRVARVLSLRRLIARIQPDLVHTVLFEADLSGRVAARLQRTPVVSSIVTISYGPEQAASPSIRPWKLGVAKRLDVASCRLVRRFHAITHHVADVMSARLGVERSRIDVVWRGRDPSTLGQRDPGRHERVRGSLGIGDGDRLVLSVGRNVWPKGQDLLLDAFAPLREVVPNAVLAIAGKPGPMTPGLEAQIAASGLADRVRLLGARADVPDLLAAADVLAFPSRWEGLGGTLIEAMALETPIVASDIPTTREVVGSDVATLVPDRTVASWVSALAEVLDGDRSLPARTQNGRKRFLEHFTAEAEGSQMVELYERALG